MKCIEILKGRLCMAVFRHIAYTDAREVKMLDIRILGCSGGIGGDLRTTSLLVGKNTLIDAGTGVGDLSLEELRAIDHIFITHSHLDHILSIPLLADAVGGQRTRPITLYALDETIADLNAHIFNWRIWPDFAVLPSKESPYIRWQSIQVGQVIDVQSAQIEALPAQHVVPAVGYAVHTPVGSIVFSGDTCYCPNFWQRLHQLPTLKALILETSFNNADQAIAQASQHFTPQSLQQALQECPANTPVYITHLKPGEEASILEELSAIPYAHIHPLVRGQVLRLA